MTGREKLYELMNNWRDISPDRSVNCYFCNALVDEREAMNADDYNDDNGGSICKSCVRTREKSESLKLVEGWVIAYYHSNPDATPEDMHKAWDAWLNDPARKQRWEEHVQNMAEVIKKTEDFDGLMGGPEMMPLEGERARESSKDDS